jgi:hypothetical protein
MSNLLEWEGPDDAPLSDVSAWVDANIKEGVVCPITGRTIKMWVQKLDTNMAQSLIRLYKVAPSRAFVHYPTALAHLTPKGQDNHKISQLKWWYFVEEELTLRPDGGRAGYWRITEPGIKFVLDEIKVPAKALTWRGEVEDWSGEEIGITDALGESFIYRELMDA